MRFWNSSVAAPIALTGCPSAATEAALVPAPGVSTTGFLASAAAVSATRAGSVVALSHAPKVTAMSRVSAEQIFVMANLLLQVLCQSRRGRLPTAEVAPPRITRSEERRVGNEGR